MLKPCWDLMACGRQGGGPQVSELGVCPAYPDHGHSCWIVAGTFCRGEVQGTFAAKHAGCSACPVYRDYSPSFGKKKDLLKRLHPEEFGACLSFLARGCT